MPTSPSRTCCLRLSAYPSHTPPPLPAPLMPMFLAAWFASTSISWYSLTLPPQSLSPVEPLRLHLSQQVGMPSPPCTGASRCSTEQHQEQHALSISISHDTMCADKVEQCEYWFEYWCERWCGGRAEGTIHLIGGLPAQRREHHTLSLSAGYDAVSSAQLPIPHNLFLNLCPAPSPPPCRQMLL